MKIIETEDIRKLLGRFKGPPILYIVSAILLAIVALGLYSLNLVLTEGHAITGISFHATMPFGMWMSLYIFFVGLSAGSMMISAAAHVMRIEKFKKIAKLGLLQAVSLLLVAMFFIYFDVGRPERAMEFIETPNPTSPLAWVGSLYLAYLLVCLGYLFLGEIWGKPILSRFFGFIAIPLAVSIHGGLGILFAVVKARPFWNTSLLPILFLTSALMSGVALLIVILAMVSRVAHMKEYEGIIPELGKLVAYFIIFDLFFLMLFSEALVVAYGNIPGAFDALMALLTGQLAVPFIGIQMVLGAIIPLIILLHPRLRTNIPLVVFASILVVAGVAAVRYNYIIAGLIPPLLPGLPYGTYTPTVAEWTVTLGWFAFWVLIMIWGIKILPILPERTEKIQTSIDR